MERNTVRSSNLRSVGYDQLTQTLEVEFKGGRVYEYYNVPSGIFQALMRAESHGTYFCKNIQFSFKYRQLT